MHSAPVICINAPSTYGDSHGIAGLRLGQLLFDCPGKHWDTYPAGIFCCVGWGKEQGCYHQLIPKGRGSYQGSEKWKSLSPHIPVGGGAVDTNDWCIVVRPWCGAACISYQGFNYNRNCLAGCTSRSSTLYSPCNLYTVINEIVQLNWQSLTNRRLCGRLFCSGHVFQSYSPLKFEKGVVCYWITPAVFTKLSWNLVYCVLLYLRNIYSIFSSHAIKWSPHLFWPFIRVFTNSIQFKLQLFVYIWM